MSEPSNDERRNPHFQRALAHAPDLGATPDWRVRKDILARAHEALGLAEEVALPAVAPSAWRRSLPWVGALIVLAGVGAGVLYQRGDLPGMRVSMHPADEPKVAKGAAQSDEPPQAAPAVTPAQAARSGPTQSTLPAGSSDEAAAWSSDPAGPLLPSLEPTVPRTADLSKPLSPEEAQQAQEAALRLRFGLREVPPLPPLPPETLPAPGAASAAAGMPPSLPPATVEPPPAPSFSALSTWTRLAIRPPGAASIAVSRGEAAELNALLGSVASTALRTKPFSGAVEWRLGFERGNEGLAVLEVGRTQVRWREKGVSPLTGEPSPGALAALKSALRAQVESHAASTAAAGSSAVDAGGAAGAARVSPSPAAPRVPPVADVAKPQEPRAAEAANPSPTRRVIKSGIPGVPDIIVNLPAGAPSEPADRP